MTKLLLACVLMMNPVQQDTSYHLPLIPPPNNAQPGIMSAQPGIISDLESALRAARDYAPAWNPRHDLEISLSLDPGHHTKIARTGQGWRIILPVYDAFRTYDSGSQIMARVDVLPSLRISAEIKP